jgi:hypothetical protein
MTMRPSISGQTALRISVASMSSMQLGLAAREIGVSTSTLRAFAEARTSLPAHTVQRLAAHLYRGAYFVKREEQRA